MSQNTDVALAVLQLVALAIPPVAVLIKMLRKSENLPWKHRKLSFGLAISSVVFFICSGISVLLFFLSNFVLAAWVKVAMVATVAGLIPFAAFTGILYREHKAEFGP